jgi:hypothetical protein
MLPVTLAKNKSYGLNHDDSGEWVGKKIEKAQIKKGGP